VPPLAAALSGERCSGWIDAGPVSDFHDTRAKTVCLPACNGLPAERIAIFRHGGKVSAVHNVCRHQGGPLGEGKIVDGCITCPWHGYQYRPHDGCAPPPFDDKVPTYRVRVVRGRVEVDPRALPPGTPVEPAVIEAEPEGVAAYV
jgi:nitrite reductase/ring-hydroxylating ferredoxin subunit